MWMPASEAPEGKVFMTKIDDEKGCRNVQAMKRQGNLWWYPNGSMYVYYRPTHYRELTAEERQREVDKVRRDADALNRVADAI